MKHLTFPSLFTTLTLAVAVTLTSCALDPLEVPDSETYTREFIKQFGTIDADHDWNLSQRVTVNLSSAMRSDVATVNVYNMMPGSPGCQIAACFTPDAQTFAFDFPSSATMAWIDGRDAAGDVVFGDYYTIKDGVISVGERASRAVTFPSGSYTCEDLSGYKAYEVKAEKDVVLDDSGNPVTDKNGNNVMAVKNYKWTPTDRSVFGTFTNTYNTTLWDSYSFASGKPASELFSPVYKSEIGLSDDEKREIVVFSKDVNNFDHRDHGSSIHNYWPYHLGNDNGSCLVQEVESEDAERDFSSLGRDVIMYNRILRYSWQQDGKDRMGYFCDKGEDYPLLLLNMLDLKELKKYRDEQCLRVRINVYYKPETSPLPTFRSGDGVEEVVFTPYNPDGTVATPDVTLKRKVVKVEEPTVFSWKIREHWAQTALSIFSAGEKSVSPDTDGKTDDGQYISTVTLGYEQFDELMKFERPCISGHGLVISKVTVQLLDMDAEPKIDPILVKPAEAPINEALRFYAIKNGGNYLKPNFDNESPGTSLHELMNLVGERGVFNEGVNKDSHRCNMLRYAERLPSMKDGVTFEVGDDGEVTLNFLYGATGFNDCFGYFYYKGDTPSDEELMKLPKYILIHNARPQRNIMAKYENGDWHHLTCEMGLDGIVNDIDGGAQVEVPRLRRSQYKLINFGYGNEPAATGTTKFEPGTKIGFFMILSGYTKFWGGKDNYNNVQDGTIQWMKPEEMLVSPSDIAFSIPSMNRNIGHVFSEAHTHEKLPDGTTDPDNRGGYKYKPSGVEDDGFMAFARYSYGGYPLLSVEDWGVKGDHDINDMIFYVSGVKTDDVKPVGTPVVQQSWLLLAEDLGGSFDFDFNDAVIGISHVATNLDDDSQAGANSAVSPRETTYGRIFLTGIAAGGTLPIEILYDGRPISDYDTNAKDFKYFHQWFGLDGPRVTNAMGFDKSLMRSFVLSGIPDFNIAPADGATHSAGTALSKFSIVVWRDGERKELKQFWTGGSEGVGEMDIAAPQMIIIPNSSGGVNSGCWKYPYECTPIQLAYPGFNEWVADKNKSIDWYHEAKRDQNVKVINHGWTGEPVDGM